MSSIVDYRKKQFTNLNTAAKVVQNSDLHESACTASTSYQHPLSGSILTMKRRKSLKSVTSFQCLIKDAHFKTKPKLHIVILLY